MDDIHARKPVNKTAALVMATGEHFKPEKKVLTNDSEFPIAIRPVAKIESGTNGFVDLTGRRVGRFTVIGPARDFARHWVVRCDCGTYSTRTAKAVKNQNNTQDRCEHCRHLAFLKRDEYRRRTGLEKDICDF